MEAAMDRNDERPGPVVIFRTNDPSRLMIAKSLLEDAGIEYAVPGETAQGLFPGGYHASEFTPGIQVRGEDADDARALLQELQEPGGDQE
jgi:hypothetical protein